MSGDRKDDISLSYLLEIGVGNSTDIKHMKDTQAAHTVAINDVKDTQHEIASDIKGINTGMEEFMRCFQKHAEGNQDTENKVQKLENTMKRWKWFGGGILASLGFLATMVSALGKKIAIALTLIP